MPKIHIPGYFCHGVKQLCKNEINNIIDIHNIHFWGGIQNMTEKSFYVDMKSVGNVFSDLLRSRDELHCMREKNNIKMPKSRKNSRKQKKRICGEEMEINC